MKDPYAFEAEPFELYTGGDEFEALDVETAGETGESEVRRGRWMPGRGGGFRRQPHSTAGRYAPRRRYPIGRPARPARPARPRWPRPRPWPAAYPYPWPAAQTNGDDVQPAERGSEFVRWAQSALNQVMNLNLPVDGMIGPATRSAIRDFQRREGLPVDGIVGLETKQALMAARNKTASNGAAPSGDDEFELYEAETDAEAGLAAASLGVAVFQVIRSIATSGDLSVQADVARYVHQNTPASIGFTKASVEFKISAHHPRYGIDTQQFYFRLSYEYNRYDLRNVSVTVLRDKSSSLYASTFSIQFSASPYSQPTDPVASIAYNIQGRWDPVGVGDVSFEGTLIVQATGSARGSITSERNWVQWEGFLNATRRDTPIAPPNTPGLVPPAPTGGTPTLRSGSRGQAVSDLQTRLNRWLVSQGRQPLTVDGDFGSRTKAAVIAFQQAARLKPDGVVGPKTWDVLKRNW